MLFTVLQIYAGVRFIEFIQCTKFRGSRAIVGLVILVSSCHRAEKQKKHKYISNIFQISYSIYIYIYIHIFFFYNNDDHILQTNN